MEIFSKYVPNFLFILLRSSIFIAMLPFFGSKNFPPQFKIGLAIAIALIITPIVDFRISEGNIAGIVIKEVIFGVTLGLSVRFIFMAVDVAGQMMSNAMGLSIATVFNPEIGQSTELARLQGIFAMLIFLAMDAHHEMIYIFVRSYELVPAGQLNINDLMAEGISMVGKVFVIGIKLGAPVMVGMLVASFLFGYMYKAAPQMNIFFVSFPVYIVLGFLIMMLSIPVFVHVFGGNIGEIKDEMSRILTIAKG